MKGQGIDRHLLGLKLISLENNMKVPALHMDVAYSLSSHHNVSTSQVIKSIKWWITCAIKWKFNEKCIKCWLAKILIIWFVKKITLSGILILPFTYIKEKVLYNKSKSNALKKFDVSSGNKSPCLPQSSCMRSNVNVYL